MSGVTVLSVDPSTTNGPSPVDELASEPSIRVLERDTLAEAKETLAQRQIDCLVTEYDLPDGTGMDLIAHVRDVDPDTGVILYTNADRDLIAAESEPDHVVEFVRKDAPESSTRVTELVETTIEYRSQTAYPIPQNEQARLAALEAYDLDSELFLSVIQRITDLAAAHFDVAQSSVNVITERTQEFLACHGEQWESAPREKSVCTYTLLADGVTVVEDTRTDPRFEGNEILEELGIRFYAGVTLTTEDGLPLGTVCLYDDTPREFTDDDVTYLELLAAEVMDWIDVFSQLQTDGDTRPDQSGDERTNEIE